MYKSTYVVNKVYKTKTIHLIKGSLIKIINNFKKVSDFRLRSYANKIVFIPHESLGIEFKIISTESVITFSSTSFWAYT